MTVALARQREYSVGAGIHSAGDAPREVHPKKRKPRIRHGVDQGPHQRGTLGSEVIILAAKWNDHDAGIISRHPADAVAEQSRTVDERSSGECAPRSLDYDLAGHAANAGGGRRSE